MTINVDHDGHDAEQDGHCNDNDSSGGNDNNDNDNDYSNTEIAITALTITSRTTAIMTAMPITYGNDNYQQQQQHTL